jgi:hypothetical protein
VSYGSFLVWKSKLKSFYKMVKDTDIMIKKKAIKKEEGTKDKN